MTPASPVDPRDPAASAFARFETLADSVPDVATPEERQTVLALVLRAGSHPTLEPFRRDPLLPLNGRFLSLDARLAGVRAILANLGEPQDMVGSVGGALYLPASRTAVACAVRVAVLRAESLERWEPPACVHPVSPDLQLSARNAFEAALRLLLFVCPGESVPFPSRVFWGVDGIEDATIEATAGDSLGLPLLLAFVSALGGLPVPSDVGATGALLPPDRVAPVGFVDEKCAAFRARRGPAARFLTPADGANIREIAARVGAPWRTRFAAAAQSGDAFSLPPSAVPTFVFAEIENAPVFWVDSAARMRAVLPLYEAMFADCMARHGGKPFLARAGTGEATGAVFADPAQAADAAVHLLRYARAALWDDVFGESLPIRVGVHRGDGEPSGDAWRGAGPALASRIAGAASAFQILASDAVHSAVTPLGWVNHGSHRLRDLSEAVVLWQVVAPGLPAVSVPPESLDTRRHNLPTPTSPLIGRETEIDELLALLETEHLVTLTGAGGVGKTRLALAAAARALFDPCTLSRFPDGAFYVSLDERIGGEDALGDAVCAAVGVTKIAALSAKRMLLILDNAEGMAEAVARFAKPLRDNAPGVVILVTSRIPMRTRGEKRFSVAPLVLPKRDSDAPEWGRSPAVRLFMGRARAVAGDGFALSAPAERESLTRLLRRLDGLPLAIELAASRTRYLNVSEIEARLADSLRLLATREVAVPARQRTLLATLEWSYALLSEPARRLLRRVSVFVGGFGVDAAEGIMGGDLDTLDLLSVLEEESFLVCRRADKGEPPRFSLLQTVSDFAGAKRREEDANGGSDDAQEAHARYFVALAARNGGERITLSEREAESFDALDRDMANLRAAWAHLKDIGDDDRRAIFAADLSDFLRRRGHARERSEWIETALATAESGEVRRRLLYAHAMTLRDTGRAPEAAIAADTLQSHVDGAGNDIHRADALALRGTIATRAKNYAEAERLFDDAEVFYRATDNRRGIGTVHSNRAVNAMRLGENDRARTLLEAALADYDAIGDEQGKAYAHNNLGHLRSEKGEYAPAKTHFLYQLNYCRRHSDTIGCAVSLFNIGEAFLHLREGDGLPLLIAAAEIFARVGHPYAEAAASDCEKWREQTNTAQSVFVALRRAASRRTLAELRESLSET